jgi:hypothetical protein
MPPKPRDAQRIVQWRRLELVQCGFPGALAEQVARDERYDLRELIELVRDGCSPALAVRILTPIDEPRATAIAKDAASSTPPAASCQLPQNDSL